ncbi:serine/threonine-protein kinase TBK1-like isoform X2 [Artemia franciscana]|uniref:Protein kinase domain-containing protein n=1 Tax=Artemia franciscana TaxID=6661 RepID=A0AA88LD31_ARTSF|nr:hypothetical protein QYM36_007255 [Artemia franciscana]
MSFLRGSANYVWCTTSVLGKGATGAVFQGVNKHTGEAVAVKTFNQLSHMRPQEVQMREFEVLKKVNHENIVKLLAIEEEEGKGKVIVMELCTGGSLFNILDDPENSCGLPEDEFLLVLEHLAAGMKHLRDLNLVHRDLKPGNIMRFVSLDGKMIYKLTDFGAARELEDDQQFVSLYGTEEYLHPDMYERAVLRKPVGKTFGATVDLWSIGVTVYHVATGNLPFRPFGGRRNKETMYYITAKKASGVISGVQVSENGEIKWSKELPDTCLLSTGLKKVVTPLFAGLMEVDASKMWNFDKFFEEVSSILARTRTFIFYVNKLQTLTVYLHPLDRYEDLQRYTMEQTEVIPASQLMLFRENLYTEFVRSDTPVSEYPVTSKQTPIILYNKDNNNVTFTSDNDMPKFPQFPPSLSVESDASTAKAMCSVAYIIKRKVVQFAETSILMHYSVDMLTTVINLQLRALSKQGEHCQELTTSLKSQCKMLDSWNESLHLILKSLGKGEVLTEKLNRMVADAMTSQMELSSRQSSLLPSIQQLSNRLRKDGALRREWMDVGKGIGSLVSAPGKSNTYSTRLKESWQHLLRDRASRVLTYNDEQFHLLEKIKMQETAKSLVTLLSIECFPTLASLAEALADWYKMAQASVLQFEILEKDAQSLEEDIMKALQHLDRVQISYRARIQEVSSTIRGGDGVVTEKEDEYTSEKKRERPRTVNKSLKELNTAQEEVLSLLKNNTQILFDFQQLAQTLTSANNTSK